MKILFLNILPIIILCFACEQESNDQAIPLPNIILYGNKIDTVYVNSTYVDRGASVMERGRSMEVEVTGAVNTSVSGIYYVDYDYKDALGNIAPTLTRTVVVMPNCASFLNGVYNVTCTCTTIDMSSEDSSTITTNYIAGVSNGWLNKEFTINTLRVGPMDISPHTVLRGNEIDVSFYIQSSEFHPDVYACGFLSPTKDTFTIETKICKLSLAKTYKCKNVYANSDLKHGKY